MFFDGVCGLCNRAVNVLLRHDPKEHFIVAPLQGSTAAQLLGDLPKQVDSIVLWENGKVYVKSEAAVRIARRLRGWPRLLVMASVLPMRMQNAIYDFVATRRYNWFGKKEHCRIPTPQERSRFLD